MQTLWSEVLLPLLLAVALPLLGAVFTKLWSGLDSWTKLNRQTQFGAGVVRAAGIVKEAIKDNPAVTTAIHNSGDALLDIGLAYLRKAYGDKGGLLEKLGNPSDEHIKNMILGQIGALDATATVALTTADPTKLVLPEVLSEAAVRASSAAITKVLDRGGVGKGGQ